MELPARTAAPAKEPPVTGITWGPLAAVLVTIAGFFVAQIVGAFLLLGIVMVIGGYTIEDVRQNDAILRDTGYVFLGNILISLMMLGLTVAFIRFRKGSLRAIGLKAVKAIDVAYALCGYGIYFVAYIVMSTVVNTVAPKILDQNQDVGFNRDTTGSGLIPIFLGLVIVPPIVEEILFRGFMYGGLRRRLSVAGATIGTSIVFASAHLLGGETSALLWIAALDTFILSLVLCGLREKTGRLYASMLVHAMKNFVAFAAIFLFKVS